MFVFVLFGVHVKIVAFSQSVQKVSNVSLRPSVVDNTGGLTVSWSPVNGINVTYTVCYSTVNGQISNPPPSEAVCVNTTATSEDFGSLLPDTVYYVWARAEAGGAVGPYSDRTSTTTYDGEWRVGTAIDQWSSYRL